jgi:hypothetical protein
MPEEKDPAARDSDSYTRDRGDTGAIADRIWRTLSATVRTVGSGEERLRSAVQAAIKDESLAALVNGLLPRELVSQLVRTADALKDDLTAQIGKQVGDFLRHVEVGREVRSMLSGLSLQVKAEIRFVATDDGTLRPKVHGDLDIGGDPEQPPETPSPEAGPEEAAKPKPEPAVKKTRARSAKPKTARKKPSSARRKPAADGAARRKTTAKRPATN